MPYVGWDWASRRHAVAVVDEAGRVVDRWAAAHSQAGLVDALRRLARHGPPAALPVAIERTGGLVVERLLAAGHPVVPVHPGAFHAARPRWGAAGAKSDPGDAYKLADYLRTDGHRLRRLTPPDAPTRQLQALVRTRDDHVGAKVAATNQLAALLDAHWPGAAALFARLDSEIALDFLERDPTPEAAARLG
jgi:transposase